MNSVRALVVICLFFVYLLSFFFCFVFASISILFIRNSHELCLSRKMNKAVGAHNKVVFKTDTYTKESACKKKKAKMEGGYLREPKTKLG